MINLTADEQLSYRELREAGLQEYYIRVIHELAARKKITRRQVDDWLKRAASQDRHIARAARSEIESLKAKPTAPDTAGAAPIAKRPKTEKMVTLVSRGDHKQAVRTARSFGLQPIPVALAALRPGQSPDAHTVQATTSVASRLITTGQWKTEG